MKNNSMVFGILSIVLLMLMSSCFVGAICINKQENSSCISSSVLENDADVPIWNVGDSWTYKIETEGEQNEYFDLEFDITIDNLNFEVVEIQDEMYKVSMSVPLGDFTGSVTADLGVFTFSGNIQNAYMNGIVYVKKSTLGIHRCEATIVGDTNKIILPHFDIDFQLEFEIEENNEGVKANLSTLSFPMNVDDTWLIPLTYMNMSINARQPNLGQNRLFTYVYEHQVECIGWDIIQLANNEYDTLKISGINHGSRNDIWYSPAVGNIIKVDYQNVELGFGYLLTELSINLKETTFETTSNPPETPSTPTGPTEVLAGDSGDYETTAIDPDGNKIRYIVDWGDGTEKSYTDFLISGETVVLSHSWRAKGDHNITVKARDKFGAESDWSDTLTVTVLNDKPNKPSTPDGPESGRIKNSYTYSTSTTDPNNHQLRYGFDWDGDDQVDDWTQFVNSGETDSKSHTWTTKGNYEIKVKAQDEFGEESEWSDPLTVSMPKNKVLNYIQIRCFKQHSHLFSLLQYLEYLIGGLFNE